MATYKAFLREPEYVRERLCEGPIPRIGETLTLPGGWGNKELHNYRVTDVRHVGGILEPTLMQVEVMADLISADPVSFEFDPPTIEFETP